MECGLAIFYRIYLAIIQTYTVIFYRICLAIIQTYTAIFLHCTVLPVMQYIQCCRKYVGLDDSETTIACAVSLANHEDPAEVKLNLHNRV